VIYPWNKERTWYAEMVPLYLARIEDLGPGDLVKIDCACSHTALLTAESLLRLGRGNREKVLDLKDRVRCRRCGVRAEPWYPSNGRRKWASAERHRGMLLANIIAARTAILTSYRNSSS